LAAITLIKTQCKIYLDLPPAQSAEGLVRRGAKMGNPVMTSVNDAQKDEEYTDHLHGDLPNVFSWQDVDVERTRIELDRGEKIGTVCRQWGTQT